MHERSGLSPPRVSLGNATFEQCKNLVVRLNLTADRQLNPLLPVLLRDTAVARNDKGITVFSVALAGEKGGLGAAGPSNLITRKPAWCIGPQP